MKNLKFFIFFFLSLFVVSACTTTRVNSIKNPDVSTQTITKILIDPQFSDPKHAKYAEEKFVEEFAKWNKNSVGFSSIFNPLKKYSDNEIVDLLAKNQIDAILRINILDSKKEVTGFYSHTTTGPGGSFTYSESDSSLLVNFEFELTFLETGEIVWRGIAYSETELDVEAIIRSLAKECVADYLEIQK